MRTSHEISTPTSAPGAPVFAPNLVEDCPPDSPAPLASLWREGAAGPTRSDRETARGIGAWFLKDELASELRKNVLLATCLNEACGISPAVSRITRCDLLGDGRPVILESELADGTTSRLMAGLSIDDPAFVGRFFDSPKMYSTVNAAPLPDQLGLLLIVPQAFLDKVKATKRVRHSLTFERLAACCSEPTASHFLEGVARAEKRFEGWGKPRAVPKWFWYT